MLYNKLATPLLVFALCFYPGIPDNPSTINKFTILDMLAWRGQDSKWHTPTFASRRDCDLWMSHHVLKGSNPEHATLNHLISLCVGKKQLVERLLTRQLLLKRWTVRQFSESDLISNRFFLLKTKLFDSSHLQPIAPRLPDTRVYDTAMYLYNEMRCGVFVKIVNQRVVMFTPFVNPDYTNRWNSDSPELDVELYYQHKAKACHRPVTTVDLPVNKWWANSYVICNEPTSDIWGGANLPQLRHMLESVCLFREVPDVEFFLNKRDIPQVRKDGKHPQTFMFAEGECPVVYSTASTRLLPVSSGYVGDEFCDVAFPLPVDWERACAGQVFPPDASGEDVLPNLPWELRMNRACFRGSCTGGGTTPETNQRLKLVLLAHSWRGGLLDAELTGWNLRDKKNDSDSPMSFIVPSDYPTISAGKHNYMPMTQQCHFKYAVYVDGHSAANRYGAMMAAGFVILRVRSISTLSNKLWFYPLLEDGVDHISVAADLSDLVEKLQWCVLNDVECRRIASQARYKWEQYMQKEGILDFVQMALYAMSDKTASESAPLFWNDVISQQGHLPPPILHSPPM